MQKAPTYCCSTVSWSRSSKKSLKCKMNTCLKETICLYETRIEPRLSAWKVSVIPITQWTLINMSKTSIFPTFHLSLECDRRNYFNDSENFFIGNNKFFERLNFSILMNGNGRTGSLKLRSLSWKFPHRKISLFIWDSHYPALLPLCCCST